MGEEGKETRANPEQGGPRKCVGDQPRILNTLRLMGHLYFRSFGGGPLNAPNLYTRVRDGAGSLHPGATWKDGQSLEGKSQPENLRNGPIIAPRGVAMGTGYEAVQEYTLLYSDTSCGD